MEAKIQETSVSVTFGPNLPAAAPSFFTLSLNFFKDPLPFDFDTVNTLSIVLPAQEQNQDALVQALQTLIEKSLSCGCLPLPADLITQKVVKSGSNVLVQFAPQGSSQEKLAELKEMAVGLGVQPIFENQKNQIKVGVSCRSFGDLANDVRNGESFISAVLKQAKLEVSVGLDEGLVPEVTNVLNNFDPSLTSIIPFVLFAAFSRATIDLKFNSTSELPETFRKLLLNPYKLREMAPEKMKLTEAPEDCLKILETIDGPVQIVASLAEMASLKIEMKGQDFAAFVKEFGNAAVEFFRYF